MGSILTKIKTYVDEINILPVTRTNSHNQFIMSLDDVLIENNNND